MRNWGLVLLIALLAAGCGPKDHKPSSPETGKLRPDTKPPCPLQPRAPYQEVTVLLQNSVPGRVAFDLEGKRRVNECNPVKDEEPVIRYERRGAKRVIFVMHYRQAGRDLPSMLTFSLKRQVDCQTGAEEELAAAKDMPITFETTYPDGKHCASQAVAKVRVGVGVEE